jgi:hypothetical protein
VIPGNELEHQKLPIYLEKKSLSYLHRTLRFYLIVGVWFSENLRLSRLENLAQVMCCALSPVIILGGVFFWWLRLKRMCLSFVSPFDGLTLILLPGYLTLKSKTIVFEKPLNCDFKCFFYIKIIKYLSNIVVFFSPTRPNLMEMRLSTGYLERLTANADVAAVLGCNPSIP